MSFLSQIWVRKDEAARQRFYDTYSWHQKIWRAFPGHDGQQRKFLFRIDDKHERFRVLLLSSERPMLPDWGEWQTREVGASFLDHARYLFQIRANPTIKRIVRAPDGTRQRNGRRTGIYDEPGLLAWLDRKAGQSGFEVLECSVGPSTTSHFNKDRKHGKHNSVDFQGLLLVTDREAFRRAFHQGIGSAKAFGFGLLMIQPVE